MSGYATFLFVHVTGALGFFAALALEWASLSQLRLALSAAQARPWLRLASLASRLAMVSMLALVATGGVMMATAWERAAWLTAAMAALVPLAGLVLAVTRPRMACIRKKVERAGSPQDVLGPLGRDRMLWVSLHVRLGIAAGIVFLMTVKPGAALAVPALAAGALLGFAAGVLARDPRGGRRTPSHVLADPQAFR